jgi:hypothetical protein
MEMDSIWMKTIKEHNTHTVTQKHPQNADHHHHDQGNWFERHHIFNPNEHISKSSRILRNHKKEF